MKIKEGFFLKNVGGVNAVVAVGKAYDSFKAMVTLNDCGALIFTAISDGLEVDAIADKIVEQYDIDREKALSDVNSFIEKLFAAGICEE